MSVPEGMAKGDRFLENLVIEGMLGRGGMGEVYLAVDEWLEREVAVKLIQRKYAEIPDFVERFRRETKALAKLSHPNIVRIYNAGRAPPPDGRLYMIMERLEGVTLHTIIKSMQSRGGLDLVSVLHYGLQIAEAVGIAHAKGVLHRDLKPENILVGQGGHLWVLDFGLAKSTTSTVHTDEKKEMGTVRYMSPEQILGRHADTRADLYAIGVVLYEMLAARHPYPVADDPEADETSIMAAHAFAAPQPLTELARPCPPSLREIVDRCLAKDREVRYQGADDLAVDLRAVLRECAPEDPITLRFVRGRADAAPAPAIEEKARPLAAPPATESAPRAGTAPLPKDFVPPSPAYQSPPSPQLGRGQTVRMSRPVPLPRLPLETTAPLPPPSAPMAPAAPEAYAFTSPGHPTPPDAGVSPAPAGATPPPQRIHPPPRRIHPPPRRITPVPGAIVTALPPVVTAPAPVALVPAPVVAAPAPVVVAPAPVVAAPAPVAVAPAPVVAARPAHRRGRFLFAPILAGILVAVGVVAVLRKPASPPDEPAAATATATASIAVPPPPMATAEASVLPGEPAAPSATPAGSVEPTVPAVASTAPSSPRPPPAAVPRSTGVALASPPPAKPAAAAKPAAPAPATSVPGGFTIFELPEDKGSKR